ncbi:MAG: DNA mismatch repair protein MutS [Chloroflexi bacterium RBG_16_57_8]|nr:MAG: DNA mismatch repair protein MutS [Chloroflexi bacterium RBG_16_57_8]
MKVCLMYRGRDFDPGERLPWNGPDLMQDLQLDRVFGAMAAGDRFLRDVAKSAALSGLNNSLDIILYRQAVLRDCLNNSPLVRRIYKLAADAIETRRKSYWGSDVSTYPPSILSGAVETLQIFLGALTELRTIADEDAGSFASEGFTQFFTRIKREISNDYLGEVQSRLNELKFPEGVLVSARLGRGNKGTNYTVRKPDGEKGWVRRVFGRRPESYTFRIGDRDETAARILSELNCRGINLVANATAQSAEHITSFLASLQNELAFYLGCVNLHGRLTDAGEPVCFPLPAPAGERRLSFEELYDLSLALEMQKPVVPNDVHADGKSLVLITGANKGGKTTFIRSVGLAQVMMQCGMFVPARSFSSGLCAGVFTHFRRKEDVSMESGKLDEELSRMSQIADRLAANSLVLFNEAFAATNQREGSEIAKQIVRALLERRVKVLFVTHLYPFAHEFYGEGMAEVLSLRAERTADGTRTYKLIEEEPLETSYGEDLYTKIFK